MMLLGEQPVDTGQTLQLRMELPDGLAAAPFIEFEARSLWSKRDINPQFHSTGFQFTAISPEAVAVVERIVEAYGFRDN
jgi:hypothetical protein